MVVDHTFNLSDDQVDLFKELINIAYGNAAGLLYDLTEVEVELNIPEVNFLTHDEFTHLVSSQLAPEMVISQQSFHGQISGETLMLFSDTEANKLSQLLNRNQEMYEDDVLSAVYEVSNIITTTSAQILSQMTKVPIAFDKPLTQMIAEQALAQLIDKIDYTQIFSISTNLTIPTVQVDAKIFYLFYRESVELLAQSLNYE